MKKGYYIVFGGSVSTGVEKKIAMQLKVFQKYYDTQYIKVPKRKRNLLQRLVNLFPWVANKWDFESLFCTLDNPYFLYIRRVTVDKGYVDFLTQVKKEYPDCKIIIEIPTYPYEKEFFDSADAVFLIKDIYYRRKLGKVIDRFATFSDDDVIFGVPAIKIKNGVLVDKILPIRNVVLDDTIDLLAVAFFQKSHGYERVIKGMAEYYEGGGQRKILLHMVGDGEERKYYEELVKRNQLSDRVIFYGQLEGKELDKIYERADIALGCFGFYKRKIEKSSALKIREYLCKGLAIVSGCNEDVFENEKENFYLEFKNDSSTVEMNKIISFYDSIYSDKKSRSAVIKMIREYAYQKAEMNVAMKLLIKYLVNDFNGKRES